MWTSFPDRCRLPVHPRPRPVLSPDPCTQNEKTGVQGSKWTSRRVHLSLEEDEDCPVLHLGKLCLKALDMR